MRLFPRPRGFMVWAYELADFRKWRLGLRSSKVAPLYGKWRSLAKP